MSQKENNPGIQCPGCGEELQNEEDIIKHLQLLHEAAKSFAKLLIAIQTELLEKKKNK